MADFLNTTLTGLRSFQRALATTSHNIANVNTDGYTRQRVNFATLPAENIGSGFIGRGVEVASITRLFDQFQINLVRSNLTEQSRLSVFTDLALTVDSLLAGDATGLSEPLEGFYSGLQALADSPASINARQVTLGEANALVDRFHSLQTRLDAEDAGIDEKLRATVDQVNALAQSVAELNVGIIEASGVTGVAPNDLLDQRDVVLRDLSELVDTEVVPQSDGSVSVFVGTGQPLVLGPQANGLAVVNGTYGVAQTDIVFTSAGNSAVTVTSNLSGGEIGGLLDFRREVLDPSRNALGRLAVGLAETFNAQHRLGMDLNGALGGDFFTIGTPEVIPAVANAGTGDFAVTVADAGQLTSADYELAFDGAAYTLTRTDTGAVVPLTGTGTAVDPLVADGLEIVVNTAPAAGDSFLIQPTRNAAGSLTTAITDPSSIAAAVPVVGGVDLTNTGTGRIGSEEILDVTDPNLLDPVTIDFIDPVTYSINGAGSFAYVDGAPIDVNGWRVVIDGAPAAGDQFTVASNAGGVGDNRNALLLGQALDRGVLEGGSTSVRDGYQRLVSVVSTTTRRSEINLAAQTAITDAAVSEHLADSGVNLDEEAANMLRFQQAYQAAAQMVGVADTLFQTLLSAIRR